MATSSGEQNVRESIRVILTTDFEERVMRPGFGGGLARFLYEPNTLDTRRQIEERCRRALMRWEPRVHLEGVTTAAVPEEPGEVLLTVTYRIRTTGTREQVRLAVQLSPS